LDKAGLLFALASFALSYTGAQMMNKMKFKIRLLKNPIERRRAYNHRLFYLNEYAKELRLNPSVKDILYEDFDKTNDEIYDIDKKHVRKSCWLVFFRTTYRGISSQPACIPSICFTAPLFCALSPIVPW